MNRPLVLNPEMYNLRANEIRDYLGAIAGDPLVIEYLMSNDILYGIIESRQGSGIENTRVVLDEVKRLDKEEFTGSARLLDMEIIWGAVIGTGIVKVGIPAAKSLVPKIQTAIGAAGATTALTLQQASKYVLEHIEQLKMTKTVADHFNRAYYNSPLTIQEIIRGSSPMWDASLANGIKWVTPGAHSATNGVWELVVNLDNLTIVHFLFNSKP